MYMFFYWGPMWSDEKWVLVDCTSNMFRWFVLSVLSVLSVLLGHYGFAKKHNNQCGISWWPMDWGSPTPHRQDFLSWDFLRVFPQQTRERSASFWASSASVCGIISSSSSVVSRENFDWDLSAWQWIKWKCGLSSQYTALSAILILIMTLVTNMHEIFVFFIAQVWLGQLAKILNTEHPVQNQSWSFYCSLDTSWKINSKLQLKNRKIYFWRIT